MDLSEYILLSREERTAHINLDTSCYPLKSNRKKKLFTALCTLLNVQNDVEDRQKARIHCCHLCCGNSRNEDGYCVNPEHVYLGTAKENQVDTQERSPSLRYRTHEERQKKSVVDLIRW